MKKRKRKEEAKKERKKQTKKQRNKRRSKQKIQSLGNNQNNLMFKNKTRIKKQTTTKNIKITTARNLRQIDWWWPELFNNSEREMECGHRGWGGVEGGGGRGRWFEVIFLHYSSILISDKVQKYECLNPG